MTREEEARKLAADYYETFSTEQGQRILNDLVKITKSEICVVPFDNEGRLDVNQMVRNEGKRAVITYIKGMMSKDITKDKQVKAKDIE